MHRLIQWIWTCHEGSPWHTTTYLISYLTLATESYGWRIRRPMFLKVWSANYGIHPLGSEATSMCACSGRYHQSSYVWSKKGRLRQIAKETKTPSMASDIYDYTPEDPIRTIGGLLSPIATRNGYHLLYFSGWIPRVLLITLAVPKAHIRTAARPPPEGLPL
jgi:hypothetical protein